MELTIFGTWKALESNPVAGMSKWIRVFTSKTAYAMMLARNVLVYAQRLSASFAKKGDSNETCSTRLYPDRTDDRRGDHRYSGRHRVAGLSGLLVRAKVSEGLARLAEAKTSVSEFYSAKSTYPDGAATAGINTLGAGYVSSVACVGTSCNQINLTFNGLDKRLAAKDVLLSATATNGQIVWKCKAGTNALSPKYLPSSCK